MDKLKMWVEYCVRNSEHTADRNERRTWFDQAGGAVQFYGMEHGADLSDWWEPYREKLEKLWIGA